MVLTSNINLRDLVHRLTPSHISATHHFQYDKLLDGVFNESSKKPDSLYGQIDTVHIDFKNVEPMCEIEILLLMWEEHVRKLTMTDPHHTSKRGLESHCRGKSA